jgi:CheY-like chemotaxis protein
MAALKLPKVYQHSKVLLADDEPEHSDWLVDYLKAKGCTTTITTNVKEALEAVEQEAFRIYLIDLNIPLGGWTPSVTGKLTSTFDEYHGLYILKLVRSQGHPGDRVIAYSAHENEAIHSEIKRLYCRYVVKGRPGEFKKEIDDLLLRPAPKRPAIYRPRPKPRPKPAQIVRAKVRAKRKMPPRTRRR